MWRHHVVSSCQLHVNHTGVSMGNHVILWMRTYNERDKIKSKGVKCFALFKKIWIHLKLNNVPASDVTLRSLPPQQPPILWYYDDDEEDEVRGRELHHPRGRGLHVLRVWDHCSDCVWIIWCGELHRYPDLKTWYYRKYLWF